MLGILLSALSFADPQFVALEEGEVAPFSGRLLNDEAIAKIGESLNYTKKKLFFRKNFLDLILQINNPAPHWSLITYL